MRKNYLWGVLALAAVVLALLIAVKGHKPETQAIPSVPAEIASTTEATTTGGTVPAARSSSTAAKAASNSPAITAKPATATLIVDGTEFALHAAEGSTLQEAMDGLQNEGAFTYSYKEYAGIGALVTSIQGRAGMNEYWILYVNGKQSDTGISSTHIRSGDVIEWKLEKSY
jgi:hypothetical protein